jgi:hypothetical protein
MRAFVCASAMLLTVNAHAQPSPAVMQSPALIGARACMTKLADSAKAANLETDTMGSAAVTILTPSREKLLPLAAEISKCLSAALPQTEVRARKDNKRKAKVWWIKIEDRFIFCFTPSNPAGPDHVATLGGHGPKRAWHTVLFRCGLGTEINIDMNV